MTRTMSMTLTMTRRTTSTALALAALMAGGSVSRAAGPAVAASVATAKPPVTTPPVASYAGFAAPASVLYDAGEDRYLVANVNGEPGAKDGNGFISVLSPGGQVSSLKWIEGGKNGVTLDAPKGLALVKGVLYVADISVVRTFDAHSGAPKATIAVPGSTFLSDLAVARDGTVYLTDAGPPTGRFDARGTETIYVLKGGKAKTLAKGALGRPESLAWSDKGLVVSSFGASEIYRLDGKGAKRDVTALPAGGLAGITPAGDSLLVASWQTSTVYRGKLGRKFEVALANQQSPGDLAYDTRRARVLVPHFTEGTVDAFELP